MVAPNGTAGDGPRPTLFALASGAVPCAIAVVRVSGPQAGAVPAWLGARPVAPRRATLRRLFCPMDGSLIDEAILLLFPGPSSPTGEDVLEIQCHGSAAVVKALYAALRAMADVQQAGPGDFTRRAFLNGRMDLSQVEALGDLLAAETDRQRRAALNLLEGGLTDRLEAIREALLGCAARIEMALDFADEGDATQAEQLIDGVQTVIAAQADVLAQLAACPGTRRLHDGIRIVLGGPPNAGKSSLFNALVGRAAAIVSAEAGTTRDIVEAMVERDGLAYVICDTAGLRDVDRQSVEGEGIARAQALMAHADILLWLGEDHPPTPDGIAVILLAAKSDLRPAAVPGRLSISATTGEGLDALWEEIGSLAVRLVPALDNFGLNDRQSSLVTSAAQALADCASLEDEILIAEHVRAALSAIDALVGRAGTENMLDALFSSFCVGK